MDAQVIDPVVGNVEIKHREGGNLMDASHEWSTRPPEERFWGLEDWAKAAQIRKDKSREGTIKPTQIRFEGKDNSLRMFARDRETHLTNWSFGQLCTRVDYPKSAFVDESGGQRLPADLTADVLNFRLQSLEDENKDIMVLLDESPNIAKVRAVTSGRFGRVYDADLVTALKQLQGLGFRTAPGRAFTEAPGYTRRATDKDVFNGTNVGVGDLIQPSGWYGSDRDSFVLLVNPDQRIEDEGGSMFRGMMLRNSEVGASSLKLTAFWLRLVCGNNILWGCKEVVEISMKHLGDTSAKWSGAMESVKSLAAVRNFDEAQNTVTRLRRFKVADTVEKAIDNIYSVRGSGLTRRFMADAYANADKFKDVDGDPLTGWGTIQAFTRESQNAGWTDERTVLDEHIGRLGERFAGAVA